MEYSHPTTADYAMQAASDAKRKSVTAEQAMLVLQDQINELTRRVETLERRVCPCQIRLG